MRKQPGRENAHVPTPKELNVNLYQNKDKGKLAGTFNTSDSVCDGCYRSSEPDRKMDEWRVQWFGDGRQDSVYSYTPLPLRLVW